MLAMFMCLSIVPTTSLHAQGVMVEHGNHRLPRPWPMPIPRPEPVTEYQIRELLIDARLKDQVAQVQVSQTFVNTGSRQIETQFLFPLPYDGAVDSLVLMVDGKEFPACSGGLSGGSKRSETNSVGGYGGGFSLEYRDAKSDEAVIVSSVRQVGNTYLIQ